LYFLFVATKLPNFTLFLQAFLAAGGIYALSNVATLIGTHVTVAVVIPVVLAILPGITTGYMAVKMRRISFFMAGATIGLALSAIILAAAQASIVQSLHIKPQIVGLTLTGILVLVGGLIALKLSTVILRISYAILGASILAISISTFFVGAQMNVFALFTSPLSYGCSTKLCWIIWGSWCGGAILAVIFVVKCCGAAMKAVKESVVDDEKAVPLLNPASHDDIE